MMGLTADVFSDILYSFTAYKYKCTQHKSYTFESSVCLSLSLSVYLCALSVYLCTYIFNPLSLSLSLVCPYILVKVYKKGENRHKFKCGQYVQLQISLYNVNTMTSQKTGALAILWTVFLQICTSDRHLDAIISLFLGGNA